MLPDLGFADFSLANRVVVFPQEPTADYFLGAAVKAATGGAIADDELAAWTAEIKGLLAARRLFASEGYFLFTGRDPQVEGSVSCGSGSGLRRLVTRGRYSTAREAPRNVPTRRVVFWVASPFFGEHRSGILDGHLNGELVLTVVEAAREMAHAKTRLRHTPEPKVLSDPSLILSVPQDRQSGAVDDVGSVASLASRALIRVSSSSMRPDARPFLPLLQHRQNHRQVQHGPPP